MRALAPCDFENFLDTHLCQVLPPIKRPEPEAQSESESDFSREEDLRDFCTTRMRSISERGLGLVLTELRKIDRY